MLVLGRKENQTILIGNDIRITIVGRSGSRVRVGVQAPREVRVVRGELERQASDPTSTPLNPDANSTPNSAPNASELSSGFDGAGSI